MSGYGVPKLKNFMVLLRPVQDASGKFVGEFRSLHIEAHMGYVDKTGTLMFRNYPADRRQTYLVSEFAAGSWHWYGLHGSVKVGEGVGQ